MSKLNNHILVSHADDLDGVASAVLLTHYIQAKFRKTPKVLFAHYDNVNEIVGQAAEKATHLWIADLSIRNLDLADVLSKYDKETLHFFDHHADTLPFVEKIDDKATVCFVHDGTKCAADLIWEYISPEMLNHKLPEALIKDELDCLKYLVQATHSRDLWVNDVQEGVDLSAVIAVLGPDKSYEHLTEGLHRVHRGNFTDLMEFCIHVANDTMTKAKNVAKASAVKTFYRPDSPKSCAAGLSVVAAITTGCQSDVGDMFLKEIPRAIVALINLEKLALSFRTTPEVIQQLGFGVNEIAKSFPGGGGHPYAAGATLTTEMLLSGPRELLSVVTQIIDQKVFEKEGIKAR